MGGSDVGDETPSPQVAGSLGGESEPDRSPSPYTCPECSGSLWDHTEGDITRYTCRVGHSFTSEALVLLQQDAIEAILWSAVRALEEKHSLCERIAKGLREGGQHSAAEPFQRRAGDALEQAAPLRAILLREEAEPEASEAPVG